MNAKQAPGSGAPALAQTLRWMLRSPLELLERYQRSYGDVFRLEIFGPRYPQDGGIGPLARRTVVVFSHPDHVQEIFSRSGDELRAGEAQQFLEWFLGPRSLMVLDGAEHHEERRVLLSLFTPERLAQYESILRAAAARAVEAWPEAEKTDLRLLVDRSLEAMNLELALGVDGKRIEQLVQLSRRARHAFSAPILFIPLLRSNLGDWSPGGQMASIRRGLRELVLEQIQRGNGAAQEASGSFLSLLLERQGGQVATEAELSLLLDRVITLLGGIDNASAAVAWTCHHLLQNPEALRRATEEARTGDEGMAAPGSYLEAACKESLRLHPPFPVVVRRVARPVSIGGVVLAPGGFVMASMYLMHRRPDLYPDPGAFQPERFLERQPRAGSYAPFGAGVRRCLGSALATRQMRVLLTEMLRRFDLRSVAPVLFQDTRRNVTVVPAKPLLVSLRLRRGPVSAKQIPGPPHSAVVQSLLSLTSQLQQGEELTRRFGDIFQVRLVMPRYSDDRRARPLVSGTVVLVSSPELLKEIFTKTGPELAGGASRRFAEWFVGRDSLLVLDGEDHRQERRELLSLFTPDRMAGADAVAREVTIEALDRLPAAGMLHLDSFLDELVREISVRLMFGPVEDAVSGRLRACVHHGLTSLGWSAPLMLFPWLRRDFGRWSPGGRAARVLEEFRRILAAEVGLTRSGVRSATSWLARLLALEAEPRDDPATVDRRVSRVLTILEGTETIAAALRWCLHHLLREPAVLALTRDDARSGTGSYLEAVCKETARIHPAIPILSRRVMQDTALGEYRLNQGMYLVGCIYLTHRRTDLYPEPDRFRPERFLERAFSPYEYLPFGGGVRRCLGQGIALRQMSLIVGELLRTFEFEGIPPTPSRAHRRAVMMVPSDPLRVRWRRASHGGSTGTSDQPASALAGRDQGG